MWAGCSPTRSTRVLGVDRLENNFEGRICFLCMVGFQKTINTGTRVEIEDARKHMIEVLGSFDGD
jgi:hypothetical protein